MVNPNILNIMKRLSFCRRLFAAFLVLSMSGTIVKAQEVFSQIVGAIAIDLPAESDVIVSFPFKQSAEFRGVIESTVDDGMLHIVVATDSLTIGSFDANGDVPTHYLVIESGTQQGVHLDIGSNTASQLTLLDGGIDAGLQNGDEIAVHPHWTLSSAFPNGVANHEELEAGDRDIEVIVPQAFSPEGNMVPEGIFYFYNGGWREVSGGLASNADSTVLNAGRAFVIRNNDETGMKALFYGEVIDAPIAIPVSESDVFVADNFVGLNRPLGIAINDLGLTNGGVFEVTTDTADPKDMLLVYSSGAGRDKHLSPISYFYFNSEWRQLGDGSGADKGADIVSPGMGVAIRKGKVDSNPQVVNWVNEWELPL